MLAGLTGRVQQKLHTGLVGLADVAGARLGAQGRSCICPFPLEIVMTLAALCVGPWPQMHGSCSRRPPGMLKREDLAGCGQGFPGRQESWFFLLSHP